MNRMDVIDVCDRHWNPTASVLYRMANRGIEKEARGSWIVDEDGKKHLDFACSYGVFIVGHGNESVRAAALQQAEQLAMRPYGVICPPTAALMKKIADMLPSDLNRVWLGNSGAEMCEIALRIVLALQAPKRKIVIAKNSYHGKTLGALNLLGQQTHRRHFEPLMEQVVLVDYGDLNAMAQALKDDVAAVFIEPILGGPYVTVPPQGYLKGVETLCRASGALLIADEIQTGFGRAGEMFTFEAEQVLPDMVMLSKGLTGGHVAIGALVLRESLNTKLEAIPGLDAALFTSGSGGCAITAAAALASIEFIQDRNLPERSRQMGQKLGAGLKAIAARHPALILSVPGTALMLGIKVRNPAVETAIVSVMGKMGVHLGHSMNESADHPVLRFYPSLLVTEEEIDICLSTLGNTMARLSARPVWFYDLFNLLIRRQYRLPRWFVYALTGAKVK